MTLRLLFVNEVKLKNARMRSQENKKRVERSLTPLVSTIRSTKAPVTPALVFNGVNIRIYDGKRKKHSGKLTRTPSLSRDCQVSHFPQDDFHKPLPPSRANTKN